MKVNIFVQVLIVCSLYALAVSQSAADLAAYAKKQQECIKELKIPADEATQIMANKDVANPSAAYKCYHDCLYKKMGLMAADGKANGERIVKYAQARFSAPVDKIKTKLTDCMTSVKKVPNACEHIYNLELCMSKALTA
ncbi:hypothetical protein AWZ03_012174 [Drosophila navojoa]|uniref:Odorant-binding protein 56b n=1 Tax=Drosophila navojoa TaxID=7232 RepID=A0A484AZI1_DRONA|nr:general odorant-binding protein 56a [Drosophila navojoa]TDG41402.1 hypothetical protein AWZ03_012174 [Drosophila navojoa]